MNKTRGDLSVLKLAITFSVCDEDRRHFDRFGAELERLGFPFAVNFDHCNAETKRFFKEHRLHLASHDNDDPNSHFDESHRQPALALVQQSGEFDWLLQMDVDETLERDAHTKIADVMVSGADVVDCVLLDLWLSDKHYRVDGPFGSSHREKFFNLRTAKKLYYYHPTSHAPKHMPHDGKAPVVVKASRPYVIHWGMMTPEDVEFHCKRWDRIYTRAVGGNPYQTYEYLRDPKVVIQMREVPERVI